MKRELNRLSPKAAENKEETGYYADGGGLYLQVSKFKTKSWVFRYMLNGKSREMGLGPFPTISLQKARIRAAAARELLVDKMDPIEARNAERAAVALQKARVITFKQCRDAYLQAHRREWHNAKHAEQWETTLATYCALIDGLPVQDVDTGLVCKVLEPIWLTKTETAKRLRGRIERVWDWAKVRGYCAGENPARWKGHLDQLLPKPSKVAKVEHHPALAHKEIGAFMEKLRSLEGITPKALEFTILTALRTKEVLGARSEEFDLEAGIWTVPASRMKAKREHKVPLSPRVIEIVKPLLGGGCVFPGKSGGHLSPNAMLSVLQRMKRDDLTVHGFRSTFRDWASEETNHPHHVCEAALAHKIPNAVEAAYHRTDLLEKRRRLMNDWARYCATPKPEGKVVPMKRSKTAA